ncbi:MAG: copper transporter [Acidimicrobiales bacterium]
MINLRYHIVSLTAVFLAIGIGLTIGSTFLDRATVENLNGQLQNLESRLADRESQVNDLEALLGQNQELQTALDEQGAGLLADRLTDVPVVVITSQGVDEDDVDDSVQALVSAGADVQGLWWFTDRWTLDDDSEIDDLATALEETTTDPSRLRRNAIDTFGGELRARQLLAVEEPAPGTDDEPGDGSGAGDVPDAGAETPGATGDTSSEPGEEEIAAQDPSDPATGAGLEVLDSLIEFGFIDFDDIGDGPDEPQFPDGTRILFVGGSPQVPDDLVIEPLVARMGRATTTPILGVASSAMQAEGEISDLVAFIREDDARREVLPTVDDLEHFEGWVAMIIALDDVADGVVGHYGLAEDATRLFPPLRTP